MPSCIICHMEIVEGLDIKEECPNEHPVHDDCLKEWLVHSLNCPLCSNKYSQSLIDRYKGYIEQKEKEKQDAFNYKIKEEEIKKIEEIAEKMVFFKYTDHIETLMEKKDYGTALDMLLSRDKTNLSTYKGQKIMFLRGKIGFLTHRYDVAISCLFKLVKENFDYPEAFLYLGKAYQKLGLDDKANWAFERVQ